MLGDESGQGGPATPAARPHAHRLDLGYVQETQPLGRLERTLQLLRSQDLREVEQGASDRGHRDAAMGRDIPGTEATHAMEVDPRPPPAAAPRDGHVDQGPVGRPQGPQRGATVMAQAGTGWVGEYGSHPPRFAPDSAIAEGIDT